jgi:hypothetical protein
VTVAVFAKARLRLTRANPKFHKGHREGSCQYGDRGLHIAALTANTLAINKRPATRCGSDVIYATLEPQWKRAPAEADATFGKDHDLAGLVMHITDKVSERG